MSNRLINETSPYLLQHARNPVDWYPWGEEALSKARAEDKPIFLSIGYAACHWCHVMERESFEDEVTARLLNDRFVCIKVDREERPDLDSIYMNAVVALTGSGGWPMSIFLSPDGKPFYGGTYFPPTPRYGMPAFREVLQAIGDAWQMRRDEILKNGEGLIEHLRQSAELVGEAESNSLSPDTLNQALLNLERRFDRTNGGWGAAPKFPQPMTIEFLLRRYVQTQDAEIRSMIDQTLRAMANGGLYDQLGGGFHRYSTDSHWLVPHFEKMLYDNSQLARVYLHAWQALGDPFYKRIAIETLDYVAREMTHLDGGFYSTQDADSEGVEGKYFTWTIDETRSILGDDAILFNAVYGVSKDGNFTETQAQGQNILNAAQPPEAVAAANGLSPDDLYKKLNEARCTLFGERDRRVKPKRDEKVLSAWNGLMLVAFAEAARDPNLGDRAAVYQLVAERNAEFLLRAIRTPRGRLLRSWKDGQAKLNGYLEDYACVIEGLLALYETTFEARWFVAARELADTMLAHFVDSAGGFFDTSDDHEALVTRPKDLQDNAVPSGNAMAATVLLRLGAFTGEDAYFKQAELMLGRLQPMLIQAPTAFAQWLCALDFALSQPREIAIIGDPQSMEVRALLKVVFARYQPNQVVAVAPADRSSSVPLLADRTAIGGKATAYVCWHFTCRQPVTDAATLARQLS